MTKSSIALKQDVDTELLWDPKVNAAQIGVSVDDGAVTLLGTVDTYAQKWAAEDAVKRVGGVRAIAQELTVKLLAGHGRTDADIVVAVQHALSWDVFVPNTVTGKVENANVTLEGLVNWNYEREAAERAVGFLTGVRAVTNRITIKTEANVAEVKEQVRAALQRQAHTDAKSIHVEASGGRVTLSGTASSWQSIEDAANAAWAAPGVTEVIDHVKREMTI